MRELLSLPYASLAIKTASPGFRVSLGMGLRPAPAVVPTNSAHWLLRAVTRSGAKDLSSPLTFCRRTQHVGATNSVHSLTKAIYFLAGRTGGT
jgi:hypothetical protein